MAEPTVRTETILDQLVADKREQLAACLSSEPMAVVRERGLSMPPPLPLAPALRGSDIRLIAEIKRASPTAGLLESDFEPVSRAAEYVQGGAAAISILTEERRFLGSLDHLAAVRAALDAETRRRTPLLRKDFLFDPYHLFEALAAGADAVLLIVAILEQSALQSLLSLAQDLGLSALVEVHDEQQVERALAAGAEIIGINNRDLRTFHTALDVTERLCRSIPDGPIVVSESGIHTIEDIRQLAACDIDAILVGEALMRSGSIVQTVHQFSNIGRPADLQMRPRAECREGTQGI